MSGTSLDGIDIVDALFWETPEQNWEFSILHADIADYSKDIKQQLVNAFELSAQDLIHLSSRIGKIYGEAVQQFMSKHKINPTEIDFIASHGQTIFHEPQKGYTLQIGNGPELAITTQLPTIVDFRTKDVALGGNGAPLIPVADFLLFNSYAESFLNLGGFSNFSFREKEQVFAFDICPVNSILNFLLQKIGKEYDEGGAFGRTGSINEELLNQLNGLPFYQQDYPRSLGWEWNKENILPLLEEKEELKNLVRTFYEHIALQISKIINQTGTKSTLVTGGGAKNHFLMERIQDLSKGKIVLPSAEIIDYKEALGFAFLGLLRWENKTNIWASVTGARKDSCSGQIIYP